MKSMSVEAFYDSYELVSVEISRRYYNGYSDRFYIEDQNGNITRCVVKMTEQYDLFVRYLLTVDEELKIGKEYELVVSNGFRTPIQYRYVVQTDRFDREYRYTGNDLGSSIKDDCTLFNLWAPTASEVMLRLVTENGIETFNMAYDIQGVWRCIIPQDLTGEKYHYLLNVNGKYVKSIDPYGKSSDANGENSVVINVEKLKAQRTDFVRLEKVTDAIIYEISVRDMTICQNSQAKSHGTFDALVQSGTKHEGKETGFDYIKTLGISHVQLMPVFDFYTVDENSKYSQYNWGYDPHQYMSLEGSFSVTPSNGVLRTQEFMNCVNAFHNANIGVNMDVVFNHVYDIALHSFEKTCPYYYFRFNDNGSYSNGSFCGNDVETRNYMVRKYIIDCCVFFADVYGIDGFRFDLMGIMDVDTMNLISQEIHKINPNAMLYGEGWNMPTALNDSEKSMNANHAKLDRISFFNDYYRDHLKGKSSEYEKNQKGYLTGDRNLLEAAKFCLAANAHPDLFHLFDSPTQSINYVECHDNGTVWDKMKHCCNDEVREIRVLRQKLILGTLLISQGIPFIHAGQEFCRTKGGYDNTYNLPDRINQIDWSRKNRHMDVVNYTRDVIALRNKYSAFRLDSAELLHEHVTFDTLENQILIYEIKGVENVDFRIYINPMKSDKMIDSDNYKLILDENGSVNKKADKYLLRAFSMIVLIK